MAVTIIGISIGRITTVAERKTAVVRTNVAGKKLVDGKMLEDEKNNEEGTRQDAEKTNGAARKHDAEVAMILCAENLTDVNKRRTNGETSPLLPARSPFLVS